MKILRYRKPSLKTVLGITKAKRRIKRKLGISQIQAVVKPSRVKQKFKRDLGLTSPKSRLVRNATKGKIPTPFGIKFK